MRRWPLVLWFLPLYLAIGGDAPDSRSRPEVTLPASPALGDAGASMPVRIRYAMPMDGLAAIDIHEKATGRRIRRLIAEAPRAEGVRNEGWDLLDDAGQPVVPGAYIWKGVALPPLKLTYELTLYNAGIPGWMAPPPAKGGGGWLADHTMAGSIAAQGDRIWISAPTAESGHALIATDLDGVKLWGMQHAFGFDGPRRVTADSRCAYAVTNTAIWRVDPERDFSIRRIYTIPHDVAVPWEAPDTGGGHGGLAVRDGKLYLSVHAPSVWLRPSFIADDVDPEQCQPPVHLYRGKGRRDPAIYPFTTYDELMMLYSALLLDRTPETTPSLRAAPIVNRADAFIGPASVDGRWKGSVIVAFRRPVTVGSVLLPDAGIRVLALKPGRTLASLGKDSDPAARVASLVASESADIEDETQVEMTENEGLDDAWTLLDDHDAAGRPGLVRAPAGGIETTALRFVTGKLDYAGIMARRFTDVSAPGQWLLGDDAQEAGGGWIVRRQEAPIHRYRPAMAARVWSTPQALRGVSVIRPPKGAEVAEHSVRIAIDCWSDPAMPRTQADMHRDSAWRTLREENYSFTPAAYTVDFGQTVTTSAIRIRFLQVCRDSRMEAGVEGLVAYSAVGDDPATACSPDISQRVTVFQLPPVTDETAEATVLRHIPLPGAGNLAFDAAGVLHALAGGAVVTVPARDSETARTVIPRERLAEPLDLAFGPDGLLYVSENGPKVVSVFNPQTAAPVRVIGTPGGLKTGTWDSRRFACPAALAVDRLGRVWVTDVTYAPKRVVRWNGNAPDRELLGPTQYGGGGTMDARDRRFVYYNSMKFSIDWDAHTWQLDSLLGQDVARTVYVGTHRYLVGPALGLGRIMTIAAERNGVAHLMAQAGALRYWDAMEASAALQEAFGGRDIATTFFIWSDRNGDGAPQPAEVNLTTAPVDATGMVGENLDFVGKGWRVTRTGIRPDGVPLYEPSEITSYNAAIPLGHSDEPWGDEAGRTFLTGARLIAADGQTVLWEYPNRYNFHEGYYATEFGSRRPPGVLNQEHHPIGHIRVGAEEFFISNSDAGDWFCFTADGMLAGCIVGGADGQPRRAWSTPEWEPGRTDLSGVWVGQEHYQGCVVSPAPGQVYAVAGHNHMSIVRIEGLDRLVRLGGEIAISAADAENSHVWRTQEELRRRMQQNAAPAPMIRTGRAPRIDGDLTDWPNAAFTVIDTTVRRGMRETETIVEGEAALAFDETHLYVAMRVRDGSPLRNAASDAATLFKGGDAAEVTIGLDPAADPARTGPAAGDTRLLFAQCGDRPVTVLYQPVAPGAASGERRGFSSPVRRLDFDRVAVLSDARVAFSVSTLKTGPHWSMEAAVPWSILGWHPPENGALVRGDFGFLRSDESGTQTVGRVDWRGKTQTVVSDIPSEARLAPALWGMLHVTPGTGELQFTRAGVMEDMSDSISKPGEATDDLDILP